MYVQIRRYDIKSGSAKELCEQALKSFGPVLRSIPGYVDHFLVAESDNKVFSISLFKDRQGIEESQKKALEWNRANASTQLSSTPEVIQGEVLFEGRLDQKLFKSAA